MLTLIVRVSMVEKMKTFFRTMLFGSLLALSANSYALSESEAEDMADLTAVFVFLKNDCGYQKRKFAARWSFLPSKTNGTSATTIALI